MFPCQRVTGSECYILGKLIHKTFQGGMSSGKPYLLYFCQQNFWLELKVVYYADIEKGGIYPVFFLVMPKDTPLGMVQHVCV